MWGCTREGGAGGPASLSHIGEAQALHTGRGGGHSPWVALEGLRSGVQTLPRPPPLQPPRLPASVTEHDTYSQL